MKETHTPEERVAKFKAATVADLERNIRHWREECGKIDAKRRIAVNALEAARPCILGYIDRCDFTKGHQILSVIDAAISKATAPTA